MWVSIVLYRVYNYEDCNVKIIMQYNIFYIFFTSLYKKPKMEKRFLNSMVVDSADEMSLLYDVFSDTEVIVLIIETLKLTFTANHKRQTSSISIKVIAPRFRQLSC